LKATQAQLIEKLRALTEDEDSEEDIQEYESVLTGIRLTLDGFSYEKKLKFIRLVAKSVSIEEVSPRWLKVVIVWKGAYASTDVAYVWCTFGSHNLYSEEELDVLRTLYAHESKATILTALSRRSWYSITRQAKAIGLSRMSRYHGLRMDRGLCMDDVNFMESVGIVFNPEWDNMVPLWNVSRNDKDGVSSVQQGNSTEMQFVHRTSIL